MFGRRTANIGIELLAAAQGCDFHGDLRSSTVLEAVRALLRSHVPTLEDDRYFHPDIEMASALIRSGAITGAISPMRLPGVAEAT